MAMAEYTQEALDAANAGLAELISQQSEEASVSQVERLKKLAARWRTAEKQRAEYIYWVKFLSAFGHYYALTIHQLHELINEL